MSSFANILVPTDFGEGSRYALDVAIDMAEKLGSTVTLLHVYGLPADAYFGAAMFPIDFESAARQALENEAARARVRFPRLTTKLLSGIAWQEIGDYTRHHGIDLIVMGTHGRRGVPRFLMGSVAEKTVRTSPCAVLVVPAPGTAERSAVAAE